MERTGVDVTTARAHLQARQSQSNRAREFARQRALEMVHGAARSVLPAFPQVHRALVFGSITRAGAMRRDSDIDIAIEGPLSAEEYFALWRELERAISGFEVEIVELDKDLRFAERVRETGEVIYEVQDSHRESGHRR